MIFNKVLRLSTIRQSDIIQNQEFVRKESEKRV